MNADYDLIVAGTGFASTFFLKKYLEKASKNTRILVLERGYLYPQAQRRKRLSGDPASVADPNPEPHQTYINQNPDKHWSFSVGFGGSSNCWYGCTPRFMPSDFRMKTLFGVARDWPIGYDDLDPYYEEAEDIMKIAGPEETPFPKKVGYPLPPHQFTTVDTLLHQAFGKLYISQPTARASRAVDGRGTCCASAVCSVCPVNAKFTIENSGLPVYADSRVEIQYGAEVAHLVLANGLARGVVYLHDGREKRAGAEVVALGTNAIFNAGILLNSGDDHPLTGKGIGEQLGLDAVVYLNDLANVGGSTWVTANGYMLYDGPHRRDYAACIMESNNAPYLRLESGKWRNAATFRMIFEDLPEERNFVRGGGSRSLPEIHFAGHSAYTMRGVSEMKKKLPAILSCLPVEKITYLEPFKTEAHILGTTRMSADPALGVVDKHLIHHRYRNLFILGAGSFTTYSPNNPTLTLCAMSLLSADKSF